MDRISILTLEITLAADSRLAWLVTWRNGDDVQQEGDEAGPFPDLREIDSAFVSLLDRLREASGLDDQPTSQLRSSARRHPAGRARPFNHAEEDDAAGS